MENKINSITSKNITTSSTMRDLVKCKDKELPSIGLDGAKKSKYTIANGVKLNKYSKLVAK